MNRPSQLKEKLTKCLIVAFVAALMLFPHILNPLSAQDYSVAKSRKWHDLAGNEITARLARYKNGVVYLRQSSGRSFKPHPSQLSKPDVDYLVTFFRNQKQDTLADEIETAVQSGGYAAGSTSNGEEGRNDAKGMFDEGTGVSGDVGSDPSMFEGGAGGFGLDSMESESSPDKSRSQRDESEMMADSGKMEDQTGSPQPGSNPYSDPEEMDDGSQTIGAEVNIENQPSTSGYKPPVILDKKEDASVVAAAEKAESRSGQIALLIGIGVVVFLIIILIAMLAMLLAKGKRKKKGFYS